MDIIKDNATTWGEEATKIKNNFDLLAGAVNPTVEVPVTLNPTIIFALDNKFSNWTDTNNSGFVQRLYRESFIYSLIKLMINKNDTHLLETNTRVTDVQKVVSENVTVELSASGYISKNVTFKLVKSATANMRNKYLSILAMGDSWTSQSYQDLGYWFNIDPTAWGKDFHYSALIGKMIEMINLDMTAYNANDTKIVYNILGTVLPASRKAVWRGQTKTFNAGCEGRGGYSAASYLRHCCNVRPLATSYVTGWFTKGAQAWDSLGLGKKIVWNSTSEANGYDYYTGTAYTAYTGSAAQLELIRITPHGYYLPDLTQELWNALKNNNMGYTLGSSYSSGENATVMAAMKDLIEVNPLNPFFDATVARSTGTYGFSVAKYISRYRTLDDSGMRLTLQSPTIGTKVTDVNAYDVNTPTNFVIEVSGNDLDAYGQISLADNVTKVKADIQQIVAKAKSDLPTSYIAIMPQRALGILFDYDNMVGYKLQSGNTRIAFYHALIASLLATYSSEITDRVSLLSSFFTLPVGCSTSYPTTDLMTGNNVRVNAADAGHPDLLGLYSLAYDVLSWVAYTKSL